MCPRDERGSHPARGRSVALLGPEGHLLVAEGVFAAMSTLHAGV